MRPRIRQKWRPSLALMLAGVLGLNLCLPLVGLFVVDRGLASPVTVGASAAAVTLLLGFLLWRLLLRPMRALVARSEDLKAGDGRALAPLPHYGTRELRDLGQSVLDMAGTLHNREAAVRTYTDHVTHELKSPLTAIQGATELLAGGDLPDDQRRRLLASVAQATDRMTRLLARMRELAAARAPMPQGHTRLGDIVPAIGSVFGDAEIHIEGATTILPIPEAGLEIVLRHLIGNATEHGATQIWLTAAATVDGAELWVRDNGSGISAGNLPRIFDPFFTTRRDSGGTGMGLSIVRTLLSTLAAEISTAPQAGGTAFRILF